MNIQRFTGATAREALGKARMAFGEGTLILSNRPTAHGVEVMATGEENLGDLQRLGSPVPAAPVRAAAPAPGAGASPAPTPAQQVAADTEQLAMSTLSFQDYVRERMLRKRQTETPARADEFGPRTAAPQAAAPAQPRAAGLPRTAVPGQAAKPAAAVRATPRDGNAPIGARSIVDELHAMRDLIEDRFNTFAWLNQAKQHPIQSNLMLKLMRAGYSPTLSRTILEHMPESLGAPEALQWMLEAIERNLKASEPGNGLLDEGGIHALVGATGVGKTTTVAKLAGLCARAHGPSSVGLITLDTQRMGAHEQLREHARSMGLVAHLAHDRAALQDLLGLFAAKRMVLIDTSGLAPRELGKEDTLNVLDLPGVRRLLVLNAGAQGDALDQVVAAFRSEGVQQAVLSKIDEAVKLGPALDVAIRHQLLLRGVTHGQKVPDDWADADPAELVRQSMRVTNPSAFDPKAADLGFYFIQPEPRPAAGGRLHA
ncbi:MAG: flagellar biosynthesis protein FlhF [Rhodoferax sp.]|jgi:flagellar biosynthesis protein FlhF|nr:flagellar biosynthesis protein FlhF [Rhodoferax sp.]